MIAADCVGFDDALVPVKIRNSARAAISMVVPLVALCPPAKAVQLAVGVQLVAVPSSMPQARMRKQAMLAVVTSSAPGSSAVLCSSIPGVPSMATVVPAPFEKCRAVIAVASDVLASVNVAVMVAPLAIAAVATVYQSETDAPPCAATLLAVWIALVQVLAVPELVTPETARSSPPPVTRLSTATTTTTSSPMATAAVVVRASEAWLLVVAPVEPSEPRSANAMRYCST